ncbi:mRNA interferase endoA [Peptococcaceae bacterium CEB3]|nr:mRNA interferase endoA [Peptococcaceae bacterium CEB3]
MNPLRGDIWLVDLNPVRGHEQAGTRPALILSVNLFNSGPAGLVVVIPITTRSKGIPFHVEVHPPEGGLTSTSYIKCEDIRSVSKNRLANRLGALSSATIELVEDRIQILLSL